MWIEAWERASRLATKLYQPKAFMAAESKKCKIQNIRNEYQYFGKYICLVVLVFKGISLLQSL